MSNEADCNGDLRTVRRASCPEPCAPIRPAARQRQHPRLRLPGFETRRGSITQLINGEPCNVILYAGDRRGTIISAKAAATINHHYYPEGEWGWVIASCAAFIHAITFGTQFGFISSDAIVALPLTHRKQLTPAQIEERLAQDDPELTFIRGE